VPACALATSGRCASAWRSYRALAQLTPDRSHRIELVDLANAIRPLTWT